MKRARACGLLTLGLTAAGACGDGAIEPITELPRALTTAERMLIAADNRFAFKLLEAVAEPETGPNLFISPLSVGMALGMVYNGAAGETEAAMRRTLELGDLTLEDINASYRGVIDLLRGLDPSVEFAIANSIWHRPQLAPEPGFLERTRRFFDAEVTALDFGRADAASTINRWVTEQTQGRITEIVRSPISDSVIAYLINAIYFKGSWTQRFDRARTGPGVFRLADGTERTVEMMRTAGAISVRHARSGDVQILDLAYGGGAFRMTIALPDTPRTLKQLAALAASDAWETWVEGLDSTSVTVVLPKFRLAYEKELAETLTALGMNPAFCDGPGVPDFSAMFPGVEACISRVRHKSFVDVSEEGTEAAAVTAVEMGVTSAPSSLAVDRPFLFAIREALSGTILFLGLVGDPGA